MASGKSPNGMYSGQSHVETAPLGINLTRLRVNQNTGVFDWNYVKSATSPTELRINDGQCAPVSGLSGVNYARLAHDPSQRNTVPFSANCQWKSDWSAEWRTTREVTVLVQRNNYDAERAQGGDGKLLHSLDTRSKSTKLILFLSEWIPRSEWSTLRLMNVQLLKGQPIPLRSSCLLGIEVLRKVFFHSPGVN